MPDVAELIYVKTNIAGFFFDAFLRADHTLKNQITSHPVQTGANITDHIYNLPQELTIEIGMSDVMQDIVDGQFSGGWSRSVTAFNVLKELWRQRIPVQILTRLGLYQNMAVETISAPDDNGTLYGLKATISFREVIVANVQTVKVSLKPQTTNKTNKGAVNAIPVDLKSVALNLYEAIVSLNKGG